MSKRTDWTRGEHYCPSPKGNEHGGYGAAVDECYELADGTLWVDNCEYTTRVNFCPFCGKAARTPIPSEGS